MFKKRRIPAGKILSFLIISGVFLSCRNAAEKENLTGEQLAKTYCSSCHAFPDPSLLDKTTWRTNVLPPMAKLLGIDYIFESQLNDSVTHQRISVKEWKKIATYYLHYAPDTMPAQQREQVSTFSKLFELQQTIVSDKKYPAVSFLRIDADNHWVLAANAFDSTLNVYDQQLKNLSSNNIHAALVDMQFGDSLSFPGERQGIMTNIGMMNPNDFNTGTVDSFRISKTGKLLFQKTIFDSLPRPVQALPIDVDHNGMNNFLVAGFGNNEGALFLMQAKGKNDYVRKIIRPLPGAIKSYIEDINKDGLPDILALMSQADEGIFLFVNKGNGDFDMKPLLKFPPVYGSSYFEWIDFNKDGFKDILYTCGDNADYSSAVLKNYHGIYIFLNDGKYNFTQRYFFPMYGCYKAMTADFDLDGDLDIAAISFFPDLKQKPRESFIYLEQKSNFNFQPFIVRQAGEGNWLTMDIGDIEGDGDTDIVLGSLIPPNKHAKEDWNLTPGKKTEILLLRNTTNHQ